VLHIQIAVAALNFAACDPGDHLFDLGVVDAP